MNVATNVDVRIMGVHEGLRKSPQPCNIPHGDRNVNLRDASAMTSDSSSARAEPRESLVDAIKAYLTTHPAAADTTEGIVAWVVGQLATVTADDVRQAVSHLEAQGQLAKRVVPGGADVFERTALPSRPSDSALRVGVDLGGTKIEVIALDAAGNERLRRREPTPHDDYDAILALVTRMVDEAERACAVPVGSASVGIGTPGSLSRATQLLRGSNSVCLNGKPVMRDLESRLGRAIALANDANCFALSEATDGAGRGFDVVFGVILGTGVGGGIVVGGRVLGGPNAIAGEWGHNPLPWPQDDERPGAHCFCGQRGCIETWLSGPGMARDHLAATGASAAPHDIVMRAQRGDAAAEATLVRYEHRLARALAHVVNIVDPDVIVLGGGLANVDRWYATVPALWTPWVFSDRVDTSIVRPVHGDSSGVRGAAWLAP